MTRAFILLKTFWAFVARRTVTLFIMACPVLLNRKFRSPASTSEYFYTPSWSWNAMKCKVVVSYSDFSDPKKLDLRLIIRLIYVYFFLLIRKSLCCKQTTVILSGSLAKVTYVIDMCSTYADAHRSFLSHMSAPTDPFPCQAWHRDVRPLKPEFKWRNERQTRDNFGQMRLCRRSWLPELSVSRLWGSWPFETPSLCVFRIIVTTVNNRDYWYE